MAKKMDPTPAGVADDPRLAFIYGEALRGLTHQQALVEGMNGRAGNLIFATAFVTSLLGGQALSNGIGLWDWIALGMLVGIGILTVFMVWPYQNYYFRFDPEDLLTRYVDDAPGTTMPEMHRILALRIKSDMARNWRMVQRLRVMLQIALVLLLLETLAWLLAVSGI
jgi:hypothetical protein